MLSREQFIGISRTPLDDYIKGIYFLPVANGGRGHDPKNSKIEAAMHCREVAAIVLPAHTMKAEARQFGADLLADLAEEIEMAGRRALESHLFPDDILPQVAQLRPLYRRTIGQLDAEANPLVQRRPHGARGPSNQEFGRL